MQLQGAFRNEDSRNRLADDYCTAPAVAPSSLISSLPEEKIVIQDAFNTPLAGFTYATETIQLWDLQYAVDGDLPIEINIVGA